MENGSIFLPPAAVGRAAAAAKSSDCGSDNAEGVQRKEVVRCDAESGSDGFVSGADDHA